MVSFDFTAVREVLRAGLEKTSGSDSHRAKVSFLPLHLQNLMYSACVFSEHANFMCFLRYNPPCFHCCLLQMYFEEYSPYKPPVLDPPCRDHLKSWRCCYNLEIAVCATYWKHYFLLYMYWPGRFIMNDQVCCSRVRRIPKQGQCWYARFSLLHIF